MDSKPIEAEGLVKRYGKLIAVDGIDLELRSGEVFGFLGPNGAGKTTTVRMLTTLLKPTAGTAKVAGYDIVKEADQVRRRIGVALQEASLDPLMKATELMRLQAVLHGMSKSVAIERTKELLERVGLTEAAHRQVRTFSGGMKRRLDLAVSLVHEPEVLFLDEPTTGLDPTSRLNLWEEVRSLNRDKGTTIFLTTQYLEEADELAERIAIIDGGKIVREGNPSSLKAQVSDPTLRVVVEEELQLKTTEILKGFGEIRPSKDEVIAIGLANGVTMMAEVVRSLDDAGISVKRLELDEPSLDDVFADATGYRLEGAEEIADAQEAAEKEAGVFDDESEK